MDKKTKMWLGLGAVALVGYYIWKQGQQPKKDATPPPSTNPPASFVGTSPTGKRHSANGSFGFKGSNIAMRNRNK